MKQLQIKSRESLINDVRDLFIRMQEGDSEAFPLLYNKMCPDVMRTITRSGVKESDVEDIMQEVFIDVVNKCNTCNEPQAALKWINRIAYNKSVDFLRKNQRETLLFEDEEDAFEESELVSPMDMPENIAESKEVQRLVNEIICRLPVAQLSVVRAYYFQDMKVHDIATTMQIPDGTVKTYLYKSRQFIEKEVKDLAKKHNTKPYSVPALPLLLWLFTLDVEACAVPADMAARVLEAATEALKVKFGQGTVAATQTAGSATKTVAATTGLFTKKIAIIIAALVLLAGGITIGVISSNNKPQPNSASGSVPATATPADAKTALTDYYKKNVLTKYGIADKEVKTLVTRGDGDTSFDKIEKLESKEGIVNTIIQDFDNDGVDELMVVTLKITLEDYGSKTKSGWEAETNDEYFYGNTEFSILIYSYNPTNGQITEVTKGQVKGPRIGQPVWSDYIIQCACKKDPEAPGGFYIYFACSFSRQAFEGRDDIAWIKTYRYGNGDVYENGKDVKRTGDRWVSLEEEDPLIPKRLFDKSNAREHEMKDRLIIEPNYTGSWGNLEQSWNDMINEFNVNYGETGWNLDTIKNSQYASTCMFLNPYGKLDKSYTDIFTFKLKSDSQIPHDGYKADKPITEGQETIVYDIISYNTTEMN
ncbi:MAG: sigma-70 family RNA polymerase sigma factor [Lachnospiraceae bacterium]|nr:sigma-70 family RNA polymerase sigma factor [Lachnospiraceae bacterium]